MKNNILGHYVVKELHPMSEPFNDETSPEEMFTHLEKYLNKKKSNVDKETAPAK